MSDELEDTKKTKLFISFSELSKDKFLIVIRLFIILLLSLVVGLSFIRFKYRSTDENIRINTNQSNAIASKNNEQERINAEEQRNKIELKKVIQKNPLAYLNLILKAGSGKRRLSNLGPIPPAEGYDTIVTIQYVNSIISIRWNLDCFYKEPFSIFRENDLLAEELINSVGVVLSILDEGKVLENMQVDKVKLEIYGQESYEDIWGETKWKPPYVILKATYNHSTLEKLFIQWENNKEVALAKIADSWYWNLKR
jgi:hypothetical protein